MQGVPMESNRDKSGQALKGSIRGGTSPPSLRRAQQMTGKSDDFLPRANRSLVHDKEDAYAEMNGKVSEHSYAALTQNRSSRTYAH
jgi:hypothetical protein